jgi:fructokinase
MLFGEVLADIFPDRTVLGGAPFNVARHLQAFGQTPVLITRLGNDALRDKVIHVMSQNRMETLGLQRDKSHPTGRVQVHIENGGHRFEILPLQAYDFIHPGVVRLTALSVNPALVYFGTLAQRCESSRRALRTLLRSTEAAKFLDINLRSPWYDEKTLLDSLQQADIVKLNDEELAILSKVFKLQGGDPQECAQELIERFGLERILVTCGDAGAWLLNRNGKKTEAHARSTMTNMVDTVGAGDGFAAVFILGTLRGWSMAKTLERANTFAGAICGIRGAVPDHADFYKAFIAEWGI